MGIGRSANAASMSPSWLSRFGRSTAAPMVDRTTTLGGAALSQCCLQFGDDSLGLGEARGRIKDRREHHEGAFDAAQRRCHRFEIFDRRDDDIRAAGRPRAGL